LVRRVSVATHVPVERAPLVTAWLSLALVIGVAWAALALPSDLLPNVGARLAAAVLLVVGPLAVPVVWLNATNAQVYLGVLAVLFLFVDVARLGRVQFPIVAVMLVLAGLSGLYAAALTPLFIALALRDRSARRIVLAVIVSACALYRSSSCSTPTRRATSRRGEARSAGSARSPVTSRRGTSGRSCSGTRSRPTCSGTRTTSSASR
jgi:hypothetical protein